MNNVVRGRSNAQGFLADYDNDASMHRTLPAAPGSG
jgi:hypothetical protein